MSAPHTYTHPDEPGLLTYKQVAEILQVSTRTVHTLADRGVIPRRRISVSVRFARRDVEAYIEAAKEGGRDAS